MLRLLVVFWLRRFALVVVVALLGLLALEFARRGQVTDFASVLGWSVGAAVLAASVSAYWAYRIQCRVVFDRDPAEPPREG
jgi:hypothetical protein